MYNLKFIQYWPLYPKTNKNKMNKFITTIKEIQLKIKLYYITETYLLYIQIMKRLTLKNIIKI